MAWMSRHWQAVASKDGALAWQAASTALRDVWWRHELPVTAGLAKQKE